MSSGLLSVLCLCLVVPMATGLRCYSCSAMEFKSGSSDVKSALATYGLPEDAACVTGDESVNSTTCVPATGYVLKCVTMRATVKGKISLGEFTGIETFRGCKHVDSNDAENNCTEYTQQRHYGIGEKRSRLQRCYCSSDNCNNETIRAPPLHLNEQTTEDPANNSADNRNFWMILAPALVPCLVRLLLTVF